jgi:hypothetical protein
MSRLRGAKTDQRAVIWVVRQRETRIGASDVGPVLAFTAVPVKPLTLPPLSAHACACRVAHLGCARGPSLSPLAAGLSGENWTVVRAERFAANFASGSPLPGLVPGIHVSSRPGSPRQRRGWPDQVRPRALFGWTGSRPRNRLRFPGQPCRSRGEGWGEGHRRCDALVAATVPRADAPRHNRDRYALLGHRRRRAFGARAGRIARLRRRTAGVDRERSKGVEFRIA